MSKLSEARAKLQNSINTVKGVVDKYPALQALGNLAIGKDGSIDFVLALLSSLGVTQKELMDEVCGWLSEKKMGDGVLDEIEKAVKAIILLNIKNMFTCTIDPIIPDSLFRDYRYGDVYDVGGQGLELNLDLIDIYGVLDNSPVSLNENAFYFDTVKQEKHEVEVKQQMEDYNLTHLYDEVEKIKKTEPTALNFYYTWKEGGYKKKTTESSEAEIWKEGEDEKKTTELSEAEIAFSRQFKITINYYTITGYTQNDVWKSRDFNAFIWYVINKGSKKWDNRVNFYNKFGETDYEAKKDDFFNENSVTIQNITFERKNILDCEYIPRPTNSFATNVLRVYIDKDSYYHKHSVSADGAEIKFNKTIFEFNYDYIYSLKLFDTKTLITNIVNSLLGFSMTGYFSKTRSVIAGSVGSIVEQIMNSEDDVITDDYFTFSNEEYNELLEKADIAYNGQYKSNNENGSLINLDNDEILDIINSIDDNAEYVPQETRIANVFKEISVTMAKNPEVSENTKFGFGIDIIHKLIKQTVTEIVMQVLSPKVMILYAINKSIMGDINYDKYKENYIDFILKNFKNVIVPIIKSVNDKIGELLVELLKKKLMPLLTEFTKKIAIEQAVSYSILVSNLVKTCGAAAGMLLNGEGGLSTAIDNVNYADIIKNIPNDESE